VGPLHRSALSAPARLVLWSRSPEIPRDGGGYDVVFAESKVSLHVLARLHELRLQKTFIHGLELIGILAPYFCSELQAVFRDAFVIHFGDNTAANGAE
jgi:hypothetical protein